MLTVSSCVVHQKAVILLLNSQALNKHISSFAGPCEAFGLNTGHEEVSIEASLFSVQIKT